MDQDLARPMSGGGDIPTDAPDWTGASPAQEAMSVSDAAIFRATFEHAAVGIGYVGLDGRWMRVNAALCEIVGYTAEELMGLTFQDLTHPDDLFTDLGYRQRLLDGQGEQYSLEKRYVRKNGKLVWIRLTVSLLRKPDGAPDVFISVIENIDERKRASSALETAHQRLSRHVDNTPLAVVEWDQELRVTRWSWRAESMFGWAFEEVEGKRAGEIGMILDADRTGVDTKMADLLEQRASCNVSPNRNIRKDGSVVHCVWYNSVVFDAEGEVASILSLADDVTAEVAAEQELRRSHEELERRVEERTAELARTVRALEHSNQELERFAYVASHDLQEPLRMVASFTKLLSDRYRGKLDEEADQFIAFALDGASRMQDMIRDLLELSRVRVDPAAQAMEVDLEACLATVRQNLSKRIEETGADFEIGPLPRVRGNDMQLTRLFQNLVGNALKFISDDAPRIRVTAEAGDSGSLVTFSVEDNGIGIEPKHRDRLFQIFQRLHGRDRYEGTGIGLTICKKIVEQHGGRIWIDDPAWDAGTAFRFTLPAA